VCRKFLYQVPEGQRLYEGIGSRRLVEDGLFVVLNLHYNFRKLRQERPVRANKTVNVFPTHDANEASPTALLYFMFVLVEIGALDDPVGVAGL